MASRAQSETLGVVLLVAITVTSVGVVAVTASGALDDARQTTSVQRVEHSMSLLDSRTALVALGRTDSQHVTMASSGDGAYRVRPNTGRIVVTREDSDGNQIGDPIVNTTLGAVVYENGDATVAYQGGGVWRSRGAGAVMVSPPEFNYRDATLTLPVVRVGGSESLATGSVTARVRPDSVDVPVFPDATSSNPLSGGRVVVTVHSEYARGWASFFRERTTGNVTVLDGGDGVRLELVARGSDATFALRDTPIELRGLASDDPIESMTFTLSPNKHSEFNDLDWTLVADEGGGERFEFHVGGGNPCKTSDPPVSLSYSDGETTDTWRNDSAFTASGSAFTYDCDGDQPTLHLDLTGGTNLTYQGSTPPVSNDSTGYLVNHYLSKLGPNVDLELLTKGKHDAPGNSESVDLAASTGEVRYSSSGSRVVTFLHVTKNTVNVTVE